MIKNGQKHNFYVRSLYSGEVANADYSGAEGDGDKDGGGDDDGNDEHDGVDSGAEGDGDKDNDGENDSLLFDPDTAEISTLFS